MRIALNTDRYRDLCEGVPEILETMRQVEQVFLPFPVLAELRAGFVCGTLAKKNEAPLTTFLNEPRVAVLLADEQISFFYARLYRQLREQGTPIPTHDLWIASLVEQHRLILSTRDSHFSKSPQLAMV